MSEDDSIQWVLDKIDRRYGSKYEAKIGRHKNKYRKEARRLKLCPKCEHVWEIGHTGAVRRYDHMPTYGLKRVKCTFCKGIKGTYKQR